MPEPPAKVWICAAAGVVLPWLTPPQPWHFGHAGAIGLLLCALAGLAVSLAMRDLHRKLVKARRSRTGAVRALRRSRQLEALATALSTAQTPAEVAHTCLSRLLPVVNAAA